MKKMIWAKIWLMFFLLLPITSCAKGKLLAQTRNYTILGFYVKDDASDSSSFQDLKKEGSQFNSVAVSCYQINGKGMISFTGGNPKEGITLAHLQKKTTFASFSNVNFDPNTAAQILATRSSRKHASEQMVNTAKRGNYNGINVDFEGVPSTKRSLYNAFIRELTQLAHSNHLKVMLSLPAKTSDDPTNDWTGAFDYRALGKEGDVISLMTYDEHGPWTNAGPIASYSWVNAALTYAVKTIPSTKLLLGIAGYAYDWNLSNPSENTDKNGSDYFNNMHYHWDQKNQSPFIIYFDYQKNKHVVWYENQNSIKSKMALVKKDRLMGVAMWRLGQEQDGLWKTVKKELS